MTAVTTSLKTLWSSNRDQIITKALRICGAVGQGETPTATAITEGAETLNDIMKALASDGMPLWKVSTITPFALTATTTYAIGVGSTVNTTAPLKVLQAFRRDTLNSPNLDTPLLIIDQQAYNTLSPKQQTGIPSQIFYQTPGVGITTVSDIKGTINVYPKPDTYSIANITIGLVVHVPFDDFALSTDVPDMPSYWFNALKWLLAADLAYEYGVGLAERSMINKMATDKKNDALSFGTEEGSLFLRPTVQYGSVGGTAY